LVVWESSWLLAEFLLRVQPFGNWAGVTVVELGAGTGVTGMFLAHAGAKVKA
jgi:predicted RNA methylase